MENESVDNSAARPERVWRIICAVCYEEFISRDMRLPCPHCGATHAHVQLVMENFAGEAQ